MKHTHLYERRTIGKNDHVIYKCMIPSCTHFLPQRELAEGRASLCWGCKTEITITKEIVSENIVRPMCEDCREERKRRNEALAQIE